MERSSAKPPVAARPRRWLRITLSAVAFFLLLGVGGVAAWVPYAKGNYELAQALKHVESGAITDEPREYAAALRDELAKPMALMVPGTYTHLSHVGSITYNAALQLGPDGAYTYALTVGNDRVHKTYRHSGRWWIEGRVFHTILLEGDSFLTAPAARDRKTPSRERIVESSPQLVVLQAPYGPPVTFLQAK